MNRMLITPCSSSLVYLRLAGRQVISITARNVAMLEVRVRGKSLTGCLAAAAAAATAAGLIMLRRGGGGVRVLTTSPHHLII